MRPEAHRAYIDIQIVLSGRERYGVALPDSGLAAVEDHLADKDIAFYPPTRREFFVDLEAGQFAVFLPGEFHRPGCAADGEEKILKAVVKVRADKLAS